MGMRRKGREIALQVLYSLEYELSENQHNYQQKLIEITNELNDKNIVKFAESLLLNVFENLDEINLRIQANSANWSLEQIAKLDRCVLNIAVGELLFTETPPAIIMNEAIEIAKKYCSESSGKFINGVLNAIAKEQ